MAFLAWHVSSRVLRKRQGWTQRHSSRLYWRQLQEHSVICQLLGLYCHLIGWLLVLQTILIEWSMNLSRSGLASWSFSALKYDVILAFHEERTANVSTTLNFVGNRICYKEYTINSWETVAQILASIYWRLNPSSCVFHFFSYKENH